MFTIRYRSVMWFAAAAAISIALVWSPLTWRVFAAPGPGESTVVSVTPTRVLDTRDPVNLGLAGPFVSPVSQKLQISGSIPTSGGTAIVVPAGATGVLLNVTVVSPGAAGFLSIRPGNATGAPSTSSLNFAAGVTVPNAVQVALPTTGATTGKIDITYDASGVAGPTTDVLIDIVGYTTNVGIQSLVADLALKANAGDVYTKAQIDGSPANALFAGGMVLNGTMSASFANFGNATSSRIGVGQYVVTLPGLLPGCVGLIPLAQVELFGVGNAETVGYGTICGTGDVRVTVNTFNSVNVLTDLNFSFTIYRQPGLLPLAAAAYGPDVICTVTVATGEEVCK
jgi:hypothetical protein